MKLFFELKTTKILTLFLILFTVSSCLDTSSRRKGIIVNDDDDDSDALLESPTTPIESLLDDDSFESDGEGAPESDSGYESCNFNDYSYYDSAIGSVIACQNSSDKTKVKIKVSKTDWSEMTCFIPTYRDGTGSSFYIGPAQCLFHDKDEVYEGTFLIDRYGYTSSSFNGLMIMKYSKTTDYFNCMLGYTNCDEFKAQGQYIDYEL
ncbi:MAG: hypothetical protein HOE90_15785 [Bacteriovoracaceae bacterium]|jgi:hypothetical protein|nr:hypothetical protein [Bacteriovoracaceae bacterium]